MKVDVDCRNGRNIGSLDLPSGATFGALLKVFEVHYPTYQIYRQRFYHQTRTPPSAPSSIYSSINNTTTALKSSSKNPSSKMTSHVGFQRLLGRWAHRRSRTWRRQHPEDCDLNRPITALPLLLLTSVLDLYHLGGFCIGQPRSTTKRCKSYTSPSS